MAYKQLAQEIAQRGVAGWEDSLVVRSDDVDDVDDTDDADDAQEV